VRTLVVGAGAAGLWCALHAAERGPVTVLAPDPTTGSATVLAQGGIAAALAEGDEPADHAADTISAGAGLCDPEAVRVLTSEAPAAIEELRARGMVFDDGGAPTLEGGHSARRVLHAGGDATGRAILHALLASTYEDRRIQWRHARAATLILAGGAVCGAATEDGDAIRADRTVLATGGATGIFGRRTGPDGSLGHGLALAWDAGAGLADVEFVQFHPTALDVPGQPARLLTEALRGEGATLLDARGRRFMEEFDPHGELAPRDVVARAIVRVRERTGEPVLLDARAVRDVRARFPTAAHSCDEAGLDLATQPIPVAPAAHYFTGGVLTDLWGRTSVPGLFACGEVASTGVHGANRLASNSLLEALVFGRRSGLAVDGDGPALDIEVPDDDARPRGDVTVEHVRALADRFLGVVREGQQLREVVRELSAPIGARSPQAAHPSRRWDGDRAATLVAWAVARAAARRTESRGGHYRDDFPDTDPAWRVRQVLSPKGWSVLHVG
jgi:L-aspartate oxidase